MQCLSSFSRAWTHVQYRAQSLLPCPFYNKSQSSEASNHKARTKQPSFHSSLTPLLHRLLRETTSPHYAGRTMLLCTSSTSTFTRPLVQRTSWMQIRRLSRLAGRTCERLTMVSLNGVLRRTLFAKPQRSRYRRRHRNGEGSQI